MTMFNYSILLDCYTQTDLCFMKKGEALILFGSVWARRSIFHSSSKPIMAEARATPLYTLNVYLAGSIHPIVSRMIKISSNATFKQLHIAIQYLFGWENEQAHEFGVYGYDPKLDLIHHRGHSVRLAKIAREDIDDEDTARLLYGAPEMFFDEEETYLREVWDSGQRTALRKQAFERQRRSPILVYEYSGFGVR